VQIDIMRHLVIGIVVQVEFDCVPFPNANEISRHIAAKGPEWILDTIRKAFGDLFYFQVYHDIRRVAPRDRRRHCRGLRQDGVFSAGRWLCGKPKPGYKKETWDGRNSQESGGFHIQFHSNHFRFQRVLSPLCHA
jgi:hypothetical protein